MKRFLGIMLVMVLAIGTLAACGKKQDNYAGDNKNTNTTTNNGTTTDNTTTDNGTTTDNKQDEIKPEGSLPFDMSSEITVVSREDGSGTRGAFIELVGVQQKNDAGEKVDLTTDEAVVTNSTSVMMTTVAGDKNAIGYISLGSLNDTVKAVKVDGAEATVENVKNGVYKVSRPFNLATKGEVSEVAQDFINYIMSDEGQKVVVDNKFIDVESTGAYAGNAPAGKIVVAGSSSVTPVMEKLKEAYLVVNPNAEIEIQETDSTAGMTSTIDGVCDIGMASRELKDSELEAGLNPVVIAMDGIAVIVNNENPTTEMTSEQIKNIYVGDALTWEEVFQ